ncbi:hypothetical protein [Candidatus Poriferisocius sp.]|uniref:hypothetical protein n=1 Tax=Candidatus Poriferisocius sp. TaxID=3101276 RepID=UPI003B529F13
MRPLKPLGPVRDRRFVLFVRCIVYKSERSASHGGTFIYPIGCFGDPPRDDSVYLPPGVEVWPRIREYGDRLLVVFGDAARDLSILGEPPGFQRVRHELGEVTPHVVRIEYRSKDKVRHIRDAQGVIVDTVHEVGKRSGWNRAIDVMQLGNIHPKGILAHEEKEPVDWLREWSQFLMQHKLGRMDWTIARQALRSLRHEVTPDTTLWQHTNPHLHAYEYQVRKAQKPVRVSPVPGHYDKLYYMDFNAFYPRIMATNAMPGQLIGWWDRGISIEHLSEIMMNTGYLVLVEYMHKRARYKVATAGMMEALATCEPEDLTVLSCAAYEKSEVLSQWARRMLHLRSIAPARIRPSAKALSVALWGKLSQRNYRYVDVTDDMTSEDVEELELARDYGAEHIDFGDVTRKLTHDGRVLENRPDAWAHDRWHAIGAHVLEKGRMMMQQAMDGCNVVYAHTDSIYSTNRIPYVEAHPHAQGDLFDVQVLRDVELDGGDRIIEGEYDARHGTTRPGIRWIWPTSPDAKPHTAYYQEVTA